MDWGSNRELLFIEGAPRGTVQIKNKLLGGGGPHRVRRVGELVVRLAGLEAPGHRGGVVDQMAGLEGASEGPRGAVLHHHLGVGVDVDRPRRSSACWGIEGMEISGDLPSRSNEGSNKPPCK